MLYLCCSTQIITILLTKLRLDFCAFVFLYFFTSFFLPSFLQTLGYNLLPLALWIILSIFILNKKIHYYYYYINYPTYNNKEIVIHDTILSMKPYLGSSILISLYTTMNYLGLIFTTLSFFFVFEYTRVIDFLIWIANHFDSHSCLRTFNACVYITYMFTYIYSILHWFISIDDQTYVYHDLSSKLICINLPLLKFFV